MIHKKGQVELWEQDMEIPTYNVGKPDKNPMFFEKRVYQGSSGRVYPLPVIDKIEDEKKLKKWRVVFLENDFLQVWIMPELGGRIQRALDKTNQYDFVYYNHVIKPALVGLAGPWISGGIEFNWPQHHRPGTFSRVEYSLTDNDDGSKTVWIGEIDQMFRTRHTTGITLYPDKAYIEIKSSLYNGTALPQTFLWWANPAYSVNDDTQSVFPPDVHAVFDHGKRDVSKFPIATGTYYKMDYSAGVDISRYKNIPVPTSYMAYHSDYDFVGGYDHKKQAGLLHIADHHISPGKKQWTWGCGDFGKAWDRNLTDEDGPYIELMTGVFTDNQPDFSWLHPYEEKTFTQYFMPYKEVGLVKNATKDVMVNLEYLDDEAKVRIYTTSEIVGAKITLIGKEAVYEEKVVDLSPLSPFVAEYQISPAEQETNLSLTLFNAAGQKLISYSPLKKETEAAPEKAKAIPVPEEIRTNEALYLAGKHLEQYRHASCEPKDYYLEGLKRDQNDFALNNAYGALLLRRGCFEESEPYFRTAVKSVSKYNANFYNSEPHYNLGLSLLMQGRCDEAYDMFYKSIWSESTRSCGFYSLAVIDAQRKDYITALEHVNTALESNTRNLKALNLKTMILRKRGELNEALKNAAATIKTDILDFGSYNEQYIIELEYAKEDKAGKILAELNKLMHGSFKNYIELSLDYAWKGFFPEALNVLSRYLEQNAESPSPMAFYYLGYFNEKSKNTETAAKHYAEGAAACPDYCFPNRLEDIHILKAAQQANPNDANAFYYLGNLWYDRKQYREAIECFEKSAAINPDYPTVHRNLAIAYYNKLHEPKQAREELEKAYALNEQDARVLFELDQLYKMIGMSPAQRLDSLEKHRSIVERRDDLYAEYITLLNMKGDFDIALKLMLAHRFHPWEGGEGKITSQYVYALVEKGKRLLKQGSFEEAVGILEKAFEYPQNLGEGKLFGAQENNINYYLGCAFSGLGMEDRALTCFEKASVGLSEPTSAMFYNDQPPETIFYQGLAHEKLGQLEKARSVFNKLIDYAEQHIGDHITLDYFAVSLPGSLIFDDDLDLRNKAHCFYLLGLGYLGFKKYAKAQAEFEKALAIDANHQGVLTHLKLAKLKNI